MMRHSAILFVGATLFAFPAAAQERQWSGTVKVVYQEPDGGLGTVTGIAQVVFGFVQTVRYPGQPIRHDYRLTSGFIDIKASGSRASDGCVTIVRPATIRVRLAPGDLGGKLSIFDTRSGARYTGVGHLTSSALMRFTTACPGDSTPSPGEEDLFLMQWFGAGSTTPDLSLYERVRSVNGVRLLAGKFSLDDVTYEVELRAQAPIGGMGARSASKPNDRCAGQRRVLADAEGLADLARRQFERYANELAALVRLSVDLAERSAAIEPGAKKERSWYMAGEAWDTFAPYLLRLIPIGSVGSAAERAGTTAADVVSLFDGSAVLPPGVGEAIDAASLISELNGYYDLYFGDWKEIGSAAEAANLIQMRQLAETMLKIGEASRGMSSLKRSMDQARDDRAKHERTIDEARQALNACEGNSSPEAGP